MAILSQDRRECALEVIEATARDIIATARAKALEKWGLELTLFPRPDFLAESLGWTVYSDCNVRCGEGSTLPGVIWVRTSADVRRWLLNVLHEMCHEEAKKRGMVLSHGDVWYLTLAVAVPEPEVRIRVSRLRRMAWVPEWAVNMRVTVYNLFRRGK